MTRFIRIRRITSQAMKEWAEFRRDRLSLALAFILPFATLILFGYGVRLQARNIAMAVDDRDKTASSRQFVSRLLATRTFVRSDQPDRIDPKDLLKAGDVRAALIIPAGFERHLDMGNSAEVRTFIDGSDINSAEVVRSVLRGACLYMESLWRAPDPHQYYVVPCMRIWFNPGLKESHFIVPGVFAIILWMYPALLAAVAVSRDIEQGTIVQAYASNLSAAELLLGKSAVYLSVGLAQALVCAVSAALLFDVTIKADYFMAALSTVIYLAGAVFFGLTAGVYTKHQTVAVQATATGGFFPSLLLSGFVYPISNIPEPLSFVCIFIPARYYIEVCRAAFDKGAGWHHLWYAPAALAIFALLFFVLARAGMSSMQVTDR